MTKLKNSIKKNKELLYKKSIDNTLVKLEIKEIKHHFKTDGWPLNYQFQKEAMGIKFDDVMHKLLDKNGFVVQYDDNVGSALIKPKNGVSNVKKYKSTK
jgi:hypothetical protein